VGLFSQFHYTGVLAFHTPVRPSALPVYTARSLRHSLTHCSAIDSTLYHTSTAQTPVISFIVSLVYFCLSSTAAWLFIQFSPFLCYALILSAVKPMDSIVGDSNAMLTRVIMSYQLLKFI